MRHNLGIKEQSVAHSVSKFEGDYFGWVIVGARTMPDDFDSKGVVLDKWINAETTAALCFHEVASVDAMIKDLLAIKKAMVKKKVL